ncbi:MAG: hypothetical protein A2Y57_02505 [Candidatus Woykebacteria bacterium RBG_13_40_7b]|uniref:Uncharacterized protein n=1 Tax=Candidatus Woykebacteria bacterium RBG_13_40_7b TaxID=1802594 RepID=A0A1G1WBE1_9BACT|nr:MAG: hypothetical protein A2Y57_02505 [Candidatus Woykebacteria bacterium RBG_13_40_7b]
MKDKLYQFLTSITGVSTLTGTALLATKRYNLATAVFAALALGSVGVLWERYSRKAGSALDLKVFLKKERIDKEEMGFLLTHLPYSFLAGLSYYLANKKNNR